MDCTTVCRKAAVSFSNHQRLLFCHKVPELLQASLLPDVKVKYLLSGWGECGLNLWILYLMGKSEKNASNLSQVADLTATDSSIHWFFMFSNQMIAADSEGQGLYRDRRSAEKLCWLKEMPLVQAARMLLTATVLILMINVKLWSEDWCH